MTLKEMITEMNKDGKAFYDKTINPFGEIMMNRVNELLATDIKWFTIKNIAKDRDCFEYELDARTDYSSRMKLHQVYAEAEYYKELGHNIGICEYIELTLNEIFKDDGIEYKIKFSDWRRISIMVEWEFKK